MAAGGVEQSLIQSGHGVVFGFALHACGVCCYLAFSYCGHACCFGNTACKFSMVPRIAVAFLSTGVKVLAVVLPESFA